MRIITHLDIWMVGDFVASSKPSGFDSLPPRENSIRFPDPFHPSISNALIGHMRIIGHLDMDAFFAAIEEQGKPHLRGLPVVVGSDPMEGRGRGVVSTANYKAREYGIKSALPISKAWKLSEEAVRKGKPRAIFINPNFKRYSEISKSIFEIIRKNIPLVETASIDEAYLDLSFAGNYKEAEKMALKLKSEIFRATGLTCSIGIGPNKLIAKIASDIQKPNGLITIYEKEAEEFLAPLPIRKIPGIGPKTEIELNKLGIETIKDIKNLKEEELRNLFGKWGVSMLRKAHGIDESPITEFYEAKSIGEQETFDKDTLDPIFLNEKLERMCKNVIDQMKKDGFKTFRAVGIVVRFRGFETKTRVHTLPSSKSDIDTLIFEAQRMLMPFLDKRENPQKKLIRLIGVRVEKLE